MWPQILRMAGWLGWAFGLYWVYVLGWTILSGHRPDHAKYWMKFISHLKRFKEKSDGFMPIGSAVFASFLMMGMFVGASRMKLNVVTQHHVVIHQQLADGDWYMSSDEDKSLVFRPCQDDIKGGVDVDALFKKGIGWVAEYAIWEERGTCKSILRPELGFWFTAVENDLTPRRAENVRP
jgi:hypothetical protein